MTPKKITWQDICLIKFKTVYKLLHLIPAEVKSINTSMTDKVCEPLGKLNSAAQLITHRLTRK